VTYTNRDGKPETFTVRRISYFVFDKDNDTVWGGQRIVTRSARVRAVRAVDHARKRRSSTYSARRR